MIELLLGMLGAAPSVIVIPGERLFTESLTSTGEGAVIIGSVGAQGIFRAAPGSGAAQAWIAPGTNGLEGVFGVLADEKQNVLWACSGTLGPPGTTAKTRFYLHAFDLKTGAARNRWPMPTSGAFCNDIAVGSDGTVYASDTNNMEIVRLKPGAQSLDVWAGGGAFGPQGGILDGIAILQGHVLVNTLASEKLFTVAVEADGKAGAVVEVKLDRPLDGPDGQRSFGTSSLLVIEGDGLGRLSRVTFDGPKFDRGKVTILQEGFPDGPTAVTVVGETAYVLGAQFAVMDAPQDPNAKPVPFKAIAVPVGKP